MSGSLHDGKPWREVVHIEDCIGGHGGDYWLLTLDCGHVAARTKPAFRAWKIFDPIEKFLAPKCVRCAYCK